jgi:hypothetical protein
MNIGSINNSNSPVYFPQPNSTTGTNQTSSATSTVAATPTHVSPFGELMSKLPQLQRQDPAQFKQVVGQLATSLQQAAQQSGNANGFLGQLAISLQQAAQTGEMPTLESPNATKDKSASDLAAHHGLGHHHHGASPASTAVSAALSSALSQVNAALGETTKTTPATVAGT